MKIRAAIRYVDGNLVIRIPIQKILAESECDIEIVETHSLTNRERQVLDQVCQGKMNKEIAAALHIGERTVKFYVSELLMKYEVSTRTELVRAVQRK